MSAAQKTFPDTPAPEISDETDFIRLRRREMGMGDAMRTQWTGEEWNTYAQAILDEARYREIDYKIIEYERREPHDATDE
jgi:hypothetical protein